MEVYFGFEKIRKVIPSVVTVGTFDGVHLGHKKLLNTVKEIALQNSLKSTLVTFDPHPRVVLQREPSSQIKLLTKLEERLELLQMEEIERVIIAKFSREFSELDYKEFIKNILVDKVGARFLIVGYDHGFGRNRGGNFEELQKISKKFGFNVQQEVALSCGNLTISSSIIRDFVGKGKVEKANKMLGRAYSVNGVVVRGEGRGRKLKFPTANLLFANDLKLLPKIGVYAVDCILNNRIHRGMCNIGTKPTFGGIHKTVEVHIINFNQDIYGEKIDINFIKRLRNEKKFNNKNELISQLEIDKENCLKIK